MTLALASTLLLGANPSFAAGDKWNNLAPIGAGPRQENATVALNNEIYLIGGLTYPDIDPLPPGAHHTTNRVEKFNPDTETWTTLAPMPLGLNHPNSAVVNGKIYVVGGLVTLTDPSSPYDYPWFATPAATFVYDPATNTWSDIADMPAGTERGASAVAVKNGKIYVAGGASCLDGPYGECFSGGYNAQTLFSVYDPATNTWASLPSLPDGGRDHFQAVFHNDKLYTFGGRIGVIGPPYGAVFAYDLTAGSWGSVSTLPTPRSGTFGALIGTKFYVMGGECNSPTNEGCGQANPVTKTYNNNEAYDFATGMWSIKGSMPVGLHGTQAAAINGKIYVPGGATSTTLLLSTANRRYKP